MKRFTKAPLSQSLTWCAKKISKLRRHSHTSRWEDCLDLCYGDSWRTGLGEDLDFSPVLRSSPYFQWQQRFLRITFGTACSDSVLVRYLYTCVRKRPSPRDGTDLSGTTHKARPDRRTWSLAKEGTARPVENDSFWKYKWSFVLHNLFAYLRSFVCTETQTHAKRTVQFPFTIHSKALDHERQIWIKIQLLSQDDEFQITFLRRSSKVFDNAIGWALDKWIHRHLHTYGCLL